MKCMIDKKECIGMECPGYNAKMQTCVLPRVMLSIIRIGSYFGLKAKEGDDAKTIQS